MWKIYALAYCIIYVVLSIRKQELEQYCAYYVKYHCMSYNRTLCPVPAEQCSTSNNKTCFLLNLIWLCVIVSLFWCYHAQNKKKYKKTKKRKTSKPMPPGNDEWMHYMLFCDILQYGKYQIDTIIQKTLYNV